MGVSGIQMVEFQVASVAARSKKVYLLPVVVTTACGMLMFGPFCDVVWFLVILSSSCSLAIILLEKRELVALL